MRAPSFIPRSRALTLVLWLAVALAAAAAGAVAYSWWTNRAGVAVPQPGAEKLLGTVLPDPDGHPQSMAQWKGRVVIVNFWATWCGPCRAEMPELVKIQARYGSRGVQLVGVAVDEMAPVKSFLQQFRVNYPILVGGFAATPLFEGSDNPRGGLPYTVVIDRSGRIAQTYLGPIEADRVARTIERLI